MENNTKNVCDQLENAGFDYAVAFATQAEIDAGAACGQLSIITEEKK
jgi:adenine C2-methylase RlmN of 23S rRNA A2503 and tRNA A37